ncbi:hypothetical protein ACET3Z_006379 [Daucus carota]
MSLTRLPMFGAKSHQEIPVLTSIPVPPAVEVSSHADIDYAPFRRPESYIMWKDDELTRVLGRESAIYEMDCEDEEWLNKFNTEKGCDEPISADVFEMIISSFEKRLFCDQGNRLDFKAAVDHCISLGRRDVLRAIHSYWIKKRKQKRSALVKVFQVYQSRTRVLRKANHGKKRSLTRKDRENEIRDMRATVLQGIAAEQKKNEKKVALKADAALTKLDDLVLGKRKKAQLLMEVADKCTYKATMALRISEAIGQGKSLVDVAKNLLG